MIKKFNLIFLIFILFIIPNTYSAINITVLQKPTLTLELVSGGSLTENTRYYFSGYYACGTSSSYVADCVSPAADIVYIDTNTTHKSIKITWGTIIAPATKINIRWDTTSLIDENGEFIPYRATSNLRYLNNIYTGFTGTDTTMIAHSYSNASGAWSHPELSVPIDEIDEKINRKKGVCRIEITATHTWDELITAIRNSDANDLAIINRDELLLMCSLYGSGKITFDRKNVSFLYSKSFNTSLEFDNSTITFFSPRQWVGLNFKINNSTVLVPETTTVNFEFYNGFSGKNNNFIFRNNAYGVNTYNSISDVVLNNNRYINFRYPQNNWYFNNSILNNTYIYYSPTITNNNALVYFNNLQFNNAQTTTTQDILITDSSYYKNKPDNFYHTIYLTNCNSDREDKLPLVGFANLDDSTNLIDIKIFASHTFSFRILDQNGDPLENATISITDNNNTNYTLTTNSLGEIDQNIQTHLITYKSEIEGGGVNRTEIIDLNPFTIIVNKDGYSTYTTTQTIQEKEEFTINLPESSLKIGSVTNSFKGVVDEIRILNKTKDPSTIKTEYNNQVDPSEFYSVGLKETAPTSSLLAWVKVPRVYENRDTPIYMYFGNPLANETNDKETWDNYYKTVMHFNEIVAVNNTPGFLDSTNNNNTGTLKLFNFDETSNTGVTGKIGYSVLLDGLDDYIEITQPTIGDNITYSHWINKKFTNSRRATKSGNGSSSSDYIIQYIEDNFRIYLGGGTPTPGYHGTSNGGIKTNDWSYITWSYDKSQLKLYVDGDLKRTVDVSRNTGIGNNPLYLGLYYGCAPPTCYENFLGNFDELRISNTIRSPEWIKTKYNNQSDPESFINIGLLEKQ